MLRDLEVGIGSDGRVVRLSGGREGVKVTSEVGRAPILKVAAVVPAYNEESRILRTIREISESGLVDTVIVVDDGSTDRTFELAASAGVVVIRHPENKGVGGAVKSGFRKALELGADVAVIMAGDGQMPVEDLPKFLQKCQEGYGLVIGNRFAEHDPRRFGMPGIRYYGAKILSFMTYIATGVRVPDSQNGYTALSREALEAIRVETLVDRWGVHNDIISRCAVAGIPIVSVPQRPRYFDERGARIGSKHRNFNVIGPNLRVFWKALGRRFMARLGWRRF